MPQYSELLIPLDQEMLQIPKAAVFFGNTWDVQRHCNAEWEFHFIKAGACRVYVDQQAYHLQAGQGLLIEPGRYHQAQVTEEPFERFTFGFSLSVGAISHQLSKKTGRSPAFSPNGEVLQTIDRIIVESSNDRPYAKTYMNALICCLTVELLRSLEVGIPSAPKETRQDTLLTQKIDTYFEQHFADSCGEAELAAQLHFSRRHLVRILKKHYNMSFREKLVNTRMDYAAFLLRTTDLPISTIAANVGYGSESFFKVFRRCFSMTPRQYRTNNKDK